MKVVGIRQVAKLAGVSTATVSRALRGLSLVNEVTRKKIERAAEALGYRPDPIMSAFSSYRHRRSRSIKHGARPLAYVTWLDDEEQMSYSRSLYENARVRALSYGYRLDRFAGVQTERFSQLERQLFSRGYIGLILEALREDQIAQLPLNRFAVVMIDRNAHDLPLHHVSLDWGQMTRSAIKRSVDFGYKRIGLVHLTTWVGDVRTGSMFWEREKLNKTVGKQPEIFLWDDRTDRKALLTAFGKWLRAENPDVIVSDNINIYWWLRAKGCFKSSKQGYINIGEVLHPGEVHVDRIAESYISLAGRSIDLIDRLVRVGERGVADDVQISLVGGRLKPGGTLIKKSPD